MEAKKELLEETACINVRYFSHLLRSEERLEILRTAYQSMDMYAVEKVLNAVFGVDSKYKGDGNG